MPTSPGDILLSMLVHGIKARFISPFRLQKQQAVGYSRFAKGFQFLSASKNPSKPLHVVQGNKIAIKNLSLPVQMQRYLTLKREYLHAWRTYFM